jgi:hypothetical protein
MDGIANGATTDRDRSGRFIAGNAARDAKQRRIAEKIRQLNADYDAVTPAQRLMLKIAAQNLDAAEVTRNATTRERSTNTALRCLRSIPRRTKPKQSAVPSLQELERIGGGK